MWFNYIVFYSSNSCSPEMLYICMPVILLVLCYNRRQVQSSIRDHFPVRRSSRKTKSEIEVSSLLLNTPCVYASGERVLCNGTVV